MSAMASAVARPAPDKHRPAADKRRVAAYQKGLQAENIAAKLLAHRGYTILSQRYRSRAGEIDIVAAKERRLSFIEVKARRNLDEAAWSITLRQQQRIADAAGLWLQEYPEYLDHDMTFDAVLVAPNARPQYIADAFRL
jgi:putative endonuclease